MKSHDHDVLLELSLAIGSSLDVELMFSQFLGSAVALLGREGAVVVEVSGIRGTRPSVVSYCPASFGAGERFRELTSDQALAGICSEIQRFNLPGFGVLIFAGPAPQWDAAFVLGLQRVIDQLARAGQACASYRGLLQKNSRLELGVRTAGIGVWEFNIGTGEGQWDEQISTLYGLGGSSGVGVAELFYDRVIAEDLPIVKAHLNNIARFGGGEASEFNFRTRMPDGSSKKMFAHVTLASDEAGERRLVGVNYDVTELELARTESLYRSEIESILTTLSMRIISAQREDFEKITNQALQEVGEYVGADRSYMMQYDFDLGLCDNTHEWCAEGITPEIGNLQGVSIEHILFWVSAHKKGLPFHLKSVAELPAGHGLREILEPQGIKSLITIPLMDRGVCTGFIGFDSVKSLRHWSDIDVTLLQLLADLLVNAALKFRREEEIEKANHALEQAKTYAEDLASRANAANETKTRFVATISHEIRTPLHAILGFSDMLRTGKKQEDFIEHVNAITESGTSLLTLINDVLDFSKIESNCIVTKQLNFNIAEFMETCSKMFVPLTTQKGLSLDFKIADDIKGVYSGDELRIRQLLNNVIGNAIKFTHSGGVTVNVRRAGADVKGPDGLLRRIAIEVVDTGIGIDRSVISRIFEPFFQVDNSNSRVYSGTGLGLTIAKMLVQLINGSISVESEPGKGAKFTILLPLLLTSATDNAVSVRADTSNVQLGAVRILFAEDNLVNQQLARVHLKNHDCPLVMVSNGAEALQKFKESSFDIVLMDCQMPVMDGFDSARAMREYQGIGSRTPIIAVTASAMLGDTDQCFAAGMDDVLIKPYSKAELLAHIHKWTNFVH